jgi:hypothetical protein
MRRLGWVLVATLILVPQVLVAPPAWAAACGNGKHIFIRQQTSTAQWGVRAKISTDLNDIEHGDCSGAAFVTAHLENCSTICGTQVETGTRQQPSNDFIFFAEKEVGGGITFVQLALVNENEFAIVRVRGVSEGYPTVKYHMEYNKLDGIGWHNAHEFTVSWGTGWPMGETEKKGDGTTMHSMHRNLQYQNSSDGQELDWLGMVCIVDEAPGWHWDRLGSSDNDYDVVSGAGTC